MSHWLSYYGNGYTAQGWSRAQKAQNVDVIASYFRSIGWTINAIAAMVGNMEAESYINPGQWEHGHPVEQQPPQYGFGLVQWTPWTKYTSWAGADFRTNYDKELYRIKYEQDWDDNYPNQGQWISTATYPFSFTDFAHATEDVAGIQWLAMCFFKNYERGVGGEAARQSNAEYWYQYLQQHSPGPWVPDDEEGTDAKKFKIMFYLKPWWKRY